MRGGSGKHRLLPLLAHPEALNEPPGGPAWKRPLLAVVIGLAVIVALFVAIDLVRGTSAEFTVFTEPASNCRGAAKPIAGNHDCFLVTVLNVGRSAGKARCAWARGTFTTGVVEPNDSAARGIAMPIGRGGPRVRCDAIAVER